MILDSKGIAAWSHNSVINAGTKIITVAAIEAFQKYLTSSFA